jgi:hypothetical protein
MVDSTASAITKRLARTYETPSYADPWDAVEDYQRVIEYAADHPNRGSQAIATALELPRSRIRPWLDGGRPDVVRGIQTAEDRGWLVEDYGAQEFRALNHLVAWVFSGGSINDKFVPSFAIDDADATPVTMHLGALGLDWRVNRADDPVRATEIVPTCDASVLGRTLVALGAPSGVKNECADVSLPEYLDAAPRWIREDFVNVYLSNRGQQRPNKATMTLREERSTRYLRDLAALFEAVAGESVTVSEQNVILSADATRALYGRLGPQQSSNA